MTLIFVKICKVLIWPILFGIGQIFICGLFVLLCSMKYSNEELTNALFTQYIHENMLWVLLIECIIFIPLFYHVYKKYRMENVSYCLRDIIQFILLSIIVSAILNFVIIFVKHMLGVSITTTSISVAVILSTGIIGPILEEFLFRGIVYGKLCIFFNSKKAFWLSIIIFAFFHSGIYDIVFAFLIGYLLTFIYQKYHDIRLSSLSHIAVNITSLLLSPLIVSLF